MSLSNATAVFKWNYSSSTSQPEDDCWTTLRCQLETTRFIVQKIVVPIIVTFGVLGNAVTVAVLTRPWMRSSTNSYLTALAIYDLLYLVRLDSTVSLAVSWTLFVTSMLSLTGIIVFLVWPSSPFFLSLNVLHISSLVIDSAVSLAVSLTKSLPSFVRSILLEPSYLTLLSLSLSGCVLCCVLDYDLDLLYLVFAFTMSLNHYVSIKHSMTYQRYRVEVGRPLTDTMSNTGVWLTLTFTVERYIAVCYPMKGKVCCNT